MKKTILVLALALGTISMSAQEVTFGAKAGLNLASISGDETDDLDSRTGFHVGAVAEFALSEKFSLQPELLYSTQGAKFDESAFEQGVEVRGETTVKLDYILLPVMAKYYLAEGLSFEAGPQLGVLVSAESEVELSGSFEGQTVSIIEEADISDEISSIDFGVNFGLGYKLENGLNFAARYNLGLSNVNDFEGSDDFKNQNSVIQFSVGYSF
jgi:opacity protein-like surface antigen